MLGNINYICKLVPEYDWADGSNFGARSHATGRWFEPALCPLPYSTVRTGYLRCHWDWHQSGKSEVATSNKHIASPHLLLLHIECATARRPHWNTSLFYEPQRCLRPHKSAAPQTKLRSHWFIPQRLLIASFNTPGLTGKGGFVTKSYYHTWTRLLIKPYNQRRLIQIRLPIQCYNLSRL